MFLTNLFTILLFNILTYTHSKIFIILFPLEEINYFEFPTQNTMPDHAKSGEKSFLIAGCMYRIQHVAALFNNNIYSYGIKLTK